MSKVLINFKKTPKNWNDLFLIWKKPDVVCSAVMMDLSPLCYCRLKFIRTDHQPLLDYDKQKGLLYAPPHKSSPGPFLPEHNSFKQKSYTESFLFYNYCKSFTRLIKNNPNDMIFYYYFYHEESSDGTWFNLSSHEIIKSINHRLEYVNQDDKLVK